MRILIVTDTDLDGVSSAIVISKYHELFDKSRWLRRKPQVDVVFPTREDLNVMFSNEELCNSFVAEYDRIYLCDTCPDGGDACHNIGTILADQMTIFDHHATTIERLRPYITRLSKIPPAGFQVFEDGRCSAKIAFDVLRGSLYDTPAAKLDVLRRLVDLTNDIDMWHRKFPRSTQLADYVCAVGAKKAYPVIRSIVENLARDVADMSAVLRSVREARQKSLSLAKATLVKHKGYKKPFYTCLVDDHASSVGSDLVANTGLIAMFDIGGKTLHFRLGPRFTGTAWHKATGQKPDCLDFAVPLGGGGHHHAAGVSTNEALPIFKELSRHLGELLLEEYNGRSKELWISFRRSYEIPTSQPRWQGIMAGKRIRSRFV
jgi:oligoribonuclease NrnB/cAMP/cGMP phosphodiesterase (DHH superfamily)